ncbi:F-box domain-containing protein [Colletotrichum asianum]
MAPVQDIPSNGNDLVDSLDRLKVDDGEPRLGRVATMEKINHNGLANGKTMGYSVRRGSSFTSNNKSHKFRVKLTDNTEMPQPVLTTILGDGGFTGMFPVLFTFAGLFADSSEVICTEVCRAVTADPCEGVQVTDEDFWNDIHIWTANIFFRRVLADKTCRALREICIPLLFRKVRIYRAEYRAIQPLKAMLLNDRIQRSRITSRLQARTSTLSHRAVAMKRSWGGGDDEY